MHQGVVMFSNSFVRRSVVFVASALLSATTLMVSGSSPVGAWQVPNTRVQIVNGFLGVDVGVMDVKVSVDADLNSYVLGKTAGGTVQVDPSTPSTVAGNNIDPAHYMSKYSPAGKHVWTVQWLEQSDRVQLLDMEVTPAGEVVVVGRTDGAADIDPGSGTVSTTDVSGVVIKFSTNGTYLWHRAFEPTAGIQLRELALAADGSIIAAGEFEGTVALDGPGGATLPTLTALSLRDGLIVSLSPNGVDQWAAHIKGSSAEEIYGLDVAPSGDVVAVSQLKGSTQLIPGTGVSPADITNGHANFGTFAWRLSSTGAHRWATVVADGATGNEFPNVANAGLIRSNGEVLVGVEAQYIYVLNSDGSSKQTLQFGSRVVGVMEELSSGKVLIAGGFGAAAVSTDLDPTSGTDTRTANGSGNNGFITTLSSSLAYENSRVLVSTSISSVRSLFATTDGGWTMVGVADPTSIELAGKTFTSAAGADSMMFLVMHNADGSTTVPLTSAPTAMSYTPGNKKITLAWTDMPYAARYVVKNTAGTTVCETTSSTCDVAGLRNGRITTYTVTAYNYEDVAATSTTSVKAAAGFLLGTSTAKERQKVALSKIVSTPSKGTKTWKVTAGQCRVVGKRLVMPTKKGRCTLQLSVARKSPYPKMSIKVAITVTKK
jgi:hypothetical protein